MWCDSYGQFFARCFTNSEDLRVNSNGDGKENVVKQFFSCPLQNINIENT